MSYATVSQIARRWQVDRATARAALQAASITPSGFHASPRYSWAEVLRKIEKLPTETLTVIDPDDRLQSAGELADRLGVTPQTVRNYGRIGILHSVRISPRTIRYSSFLLRKSESEEKTGDLRQK
ncbi:MULTISPECIES: MerR family transcriptional regulator [unclassified Leisingera]|uniref:MerR family transcriptional regulator n=1 Tax=unclassified Leisingera TaxID=2614906 RepID=UPI001269A9A0|nr:MULTISPECIES: MerR family DNA-binding transcriptional regulator [unclassified Leisingera]